MATQNTALPTGVKVLSWINLVGGAIFLLATAAAPRGAEAVLMLAIGAVALLTGIGLLQGRRWGRMLAIGAYALNIAGAIASVNPIALVISGAILAYLCSAAVRDAFSAPETVTVSSLAA
jgi:hypothetical protein